MSQQHLGGGVIDVEVASKSHVWKKRFGSVPSFGSSACQVVSVTDIGGVGNFTLGDVKAIQHLTKLFPVLDCVLCTGLIANRSENFL